MNIADLAKPFHVDAVHWRAQNVTGKGDKALALAYIDARDVMDRLDNVCGPANWQTYYDETPTGRVICKLSIRIDNEWICKSDGAGSTAVEGEKGGISDALKRAAVSWGIGRYLYDLKDVWAPCESYEKNGKRYFRKWLPSAYPMFRQALEELERGNVPPATISEEQRTELMNLCDATGVNVKAFLDAGGIADLSQVPANKFENAKAWIDAAAKKKENT